MLIAADALLPARTQMALSLGWHIVLACYGMAFPAVIFYVHRRGLRGDREALVLAKRWSKVAGVLFAIGAVSGTVLSFEMGLLWPGLMATFGDVIGLAFSLEALSFFVEAIFLGIYLYGWGRLRGQVHLLMLVPIMAAGVIGSFLVISVNAWMNAPAGFTVAGEAASAGGSGLVVTDVDPLAAMFNSSVGLQYLHMYLAAVMVVGYSVAGVYAMGWLRGRRDRLHRIGILVPLTYAAIATPLQPIVGHFAGQRLADEQPIKLAAMEGLATSTDRARLELGGIWDGEELVGAIEIPVDGLLSFLATNDFDATVTGLDAVPADERPPVGVVHLAFQTMLAIGTALVALAAWFAWRWRRHGDGVLASPWLLRAVVVAGPAAVVALETGWITTEVGRQPWIVHGILRTEEAVTDAGYVWATLVGLVALYGAMTAGAVGVLSSMSRRWAAGEEDLASPYGPSLATAAGAEPEPDTGDEPVGAPR